MQLQQEQEAEVLSAINSLVKSVNKNPNATADISALVGVTSRISLKNLNQWERFIRRHIAYAMQVSMPPKWQFWHKPTTIIFSTWIDLCSHNGLLREKALRTLSGGAPNRFFLSMAIRRLNDWVPQVKDAACDKLPALARNTDPKIVAEVLCQTLAHWNSWGRMNERERQVLLYIASIPEIAVQLKAIIISSVGGPIALLLSQVGRLDFLDSSLHEIAQSAVQPSVRAKAYRSLLEGKMTWFTGRVWVWTDKRYCEGYYKPVLCSRELVVSVLFSQFIELAVNDKSAIVRRVAGEMLIREPSKVGSKYRKLIETLASDKSRSVSERGAFALRSLEGD